MLNGRYMLRALQMILIAGTMCTATFGGFWALRPFLNPPQGLHPTGWTYAQLIRDRYPMRIVDPAWLGDDNYWFLAETGARLVVVGCVVGFLFALARVACKSPAEYNSKQQ